MRDAPVRPDDPDRDIVGVINAGDTTTALRMLMQRHGTSVYRYCREALRDAALAEDVHQQIFIQAHRALTRFSGRSTLRTWLFGIAHHRVLDAAKSRQRVQAHVEHDDTADATDPGAPPGERIDDRRLVEALLACVAELPEDQQLAVLLRYQQGFTFEDMAELCDQKPGTLQARVTRALPALRKCIEGRTGGKL